MTVTPIRMFTIGGSNCAAAAGIHPHVSRIMEWLYLTGRVERPETEAMRWGKLLEPVVFEELRERGYDAAAGTATAHDPDRPWCYGHPDGTVLLDRVESLLEVKTAGVWSHKWNGGGPPVEYVAQCQHYLHLTGLERALLATLVGGQRLELHTIEREQSAIDALLRLEEDFYGYLVRDEPPAPDGSKSAREALAALYPEASAGHTIRATREEEEWVRELRARREQRDTVDEQIRELESNLKAMMGDAETLVSLHDTPLVKYANVQTTALDRASMKVLAPRAYADSMTTKLTRRFTLL